MSDTYWLPGFQTNTDEIPPPDGARPAASLPDATRVDYATRWATAITARIALDGAWGLLIEKPNGTWHLEGLRNIAATLLDYNATTVYLVHTANGWTSPQDPCRDCHGTGTILDTRNAVRSVRCGCPDGTSHHGSLPTGIIPTGSDLDGYLTIDADHLT